MEQKPFLERIQNFAAQELFGEKESRRQEERQAASSSGSMTSLDGLQRFEFHKQQRLRHQLSAQLHEIFFHSLCAIACDRLRTPPPSQQESQGQRHLAVCGLPHGSTDCLCSV